MSANSIPPYQRKSRIAGFCIECSLTLSLIVAICLILLNPIMPEFADAQPWLLEAEQAIVLSSLAILVLPTCYLAGWLLTSGGRLAVARLQKSRNQPEIG